jgi:hypothetical protein
VIVPARRVEPALGGELGALLRHDAGGMRLVAERDLQHLVGRRHLQVERQVDLGAEPVDVVVGDVPAILAQMRGDAVRPGLRRELRRAHGVGVLDAARVPDGRDMVDVDAEAKVTPGCAHLRCFLVLRGLSRAPDRPN